MVLSIFLFETAFLLSFLFKLPINGLFFVLTPTILLFCAFFINYKIFPSLIFKAILVQIFLIHKPNKMIQPIILAVLMFYVFI